MNPPSCGRVASLNKSGIDHGFSHKEPRIFADAADQDGLSARIPNIREYPQFLPLWMYMKTAVEIETQSACQLKKLIARSARVEGKEFRSKRLARCR